MIKLSIQKHTISEAATILDYEPHVLRFYEGEFDIHVPRDKSNRREYTIKEIETALDAKLEDYNGKYNDDYEELEETVYYDDDLLDLEDYIYNEVISSLPMKTLCHKDCKGLCPKCGANLNTESCDCIQEEIDPRLEKLKDFFKN